MRRKHRKEVVEEEEGDEESESSVSVEDESDVEAST